MIREIKYRIRKRSTSTKSDIELVKRYYGGRTATEKIGFTYVKPVNSHESRHNAQIIKKASEIVNKVKEYLSEKEANSQRNHKTFMEFLISLKETRKSLNAPLKHFIRFLQFEKLPLNLPWAYADLELFEKFYSYLHEVAKKKNGDVLSQNSAEGYFEKIAGALHNAVNKGYLDKNPLFKGAIKRKGMSDIQRPWVSSFELDNLQELQLEDKKDVELRDAFVLSCNIGGRPSDIAKIKKSDVVRTQDGRVVVPLTMTKTSKNVLMLIPKELVPMVKSYLESNADSEFLFPNYKYSNNTNQKLRRLAKKAGILKPITLGCGRHSFVTNLLESGIVDSKLIQLSLGHTSPKSIDSYINFGNGAMHRIIEQGLNYRANQGSQVA